MSVRTYIKIPVFKTILTSRPVNLLIPSAIIGIPNAKVVPAPPISPNINNISMSVPTGTSANFPMTGLVASLILRTGFLRTVEISDGECR